MADQTEKAFLKQPNVSPCSKKLRVLIAVSATENTMGGRLNDLIQAFESCVDLSGVVITRTATELVGEMNLPCPFYKSDDDIRNPIQVDLSTELLAKSDLILLIANTNIVAKIVLGQIGDLITTIAALSIPKMVIITDIPDDIKDFPPVAKNLLTLKQWGYEIAELENFVGSTGSVNWSSLANWTVENRETLVPLC